MAFVLSDLMAGFEQLWPLSGADDWDAPGLVTGFKNARISRVLLTVDVTQDVIDEAIAGGFDLILAHHPLLLKGVKSIAEDSSKGSILARAIRGNVAMFPQLWRNLSESPIHNRLSKSLRMLAMVESAISHQRFHSENLPRALLGSSPRRPAVFVSPVNSTQQSLALLYAAEQAIPSSRRLMSPAQMCTLLLTFGITRFKKSLNVRVPKIELSRLSIFHTGLQSGCG